MRVFIALDVNSKDFSSLARTFVLAIVRDAALAPMDSGSIAAERRQRLCFMAGRRVRYGDRNEVHRDRPTGQ